MVKQDQPHRPRQFACTCALTLFAALLAACTPLTGVKTSDREEQQTSRPDGGPLEEAGGRGGAGAKDKVQSSTPEGAGGETAESAKAPAGDPKAGADAKRAEDGRGGMDAKPADDARTGAAASGGSDVSELQDVTCVPLYIQEARGQFVQVRCQAPIMLGADRVEYLALPTKTQQATCTRFSELASAALLRAAPIGLRVNRSGRGNDSGCEAARCRTIRAFFQGM